MSLRRTLVSTLLVLLALAASVGVANASPTADATQAGDANVTTFIAPGDALDALRTGSTTEPLTPRQRVTVADALVVRLSAPGLGAAVDAQPGNTTTTRVRELLSGPDASLTAVEISSGGGPPRVLDLTGEDLVVRRTGENTVELIYDTGELQTTPDRNRNGRADDGVRSTISPTRVFRLDFSFEGTTEKTSLGVFSPSIVFSTPQSDGVVVYPLPDQRIVGQTPLAPGTAVSISVETESGSVATERGVITTGRRQSFANLSLDLADTPGGESLTVTARFDGGRLGRTTGRIGELAASFATSESDAPRNRLRLRNVSFSADGFLVVRDGEDGPLVANRYVEAGEYESLTVQYRREVTSDAVAVTAYVDADGDRILERSGPDRPFRRDGDPVSTVVDLDASTPAPATDTVTTAPPTSAETPTTASSSPAASGTGQQTRVRITDASGDGFAPAAALAALALVTAALARRE